MKTEPLCAILLAAGLSRRFQSVKLLAEIGEKPLFQRTFDVAAVCGFDQIAAVTNEAAITKAALAQGFLPVHNLQAQEGIAASIRCGVKVTPGAAAWVFFVCDQPFLRPESVCRIISCWRATGKAVIPRFGGTPGNPCLIPAFCRDELLALQGDAGGKQVLYRLPPDKITYVDLPDIHEAQDIDTIQDYEKAAAPIFPGG